LRLKQIHKLLNEGASQSAILEIEELLDEEPEHLEGLFLLGEACLDAGSIEIARLAYERHVGLTNGRDPLSLLGLGVAHLELCALPEALESIREACRLAPDLADAHYHLGLTLNYLGMDDEAQEAFDQARAIEPNAFPPPLELSEEEWESAIHEALSRVQDDVRTFWSGVPVHLHALPKLTLLKSTTPPTSPNIAGMYIGSPPEEGEAHNHRPEALELYVSNLALCRTRTELVEQIGLTLHTEALNWLGLPPLNRS